MGVPSFYRWLVDKYPKTVVNAVEEADCADSSHKNPNGMEFDNLYLDMNGIIHPCFHPEDQLTSPASFEEVFASIFQYIDRIFKIVRPRKLLYMAIDGVAPRAKMNQQRTRRFRTAKDAELVEAEEDRLRKEFERAGKEVLPKEENEVSDSNVITPGTVFMEKLAKALEYYIHRRLSTDPGWKSIKVILSNANVPGEGEHKIMAFIRSQRSLPGYNPNTHHCLYGLDADLIMLALATHEINFSILREDVMKREQHENLMPSFTANFSRMELDQIKSRQWFPKLFAAKSKIPKKPYQFINVWTLREYLELDMKIMDAPFDIDFERIVDDFIFLCFLTGNDFLPHLPTLEIHEGAIDLLIAVYQKVFKANGGYLVDTSKIKEKKAAYMKFKQVERFILEVGTFEDKIFQKRYKLRQKYIESLKRKLEEEKNDYEKLKQDEIEHGDSGFRSALNRKDNLSGIHLAGCSSSRDSEMCKPRHGSSQVENIEGYSDVLQKNTKELKQKLKEHLQNNRDLFKNGVFEIDKVKLGHDGWKRRYYREKFSAGNPTETECVRKIIVEKYVEGVCWVLHYYFAGVSSWSWFYPFHYGPFASDLRGLVHPREFKIGKPFKPFDQLMAVLPPRSSHALPEVYRNLMKSQDSALIKFYPQDFEVDMDGKRYTWQGVCKLPLIDEEELLSATKMIEKDLKIDEVNMNCIGHDKIFVRESHALGSEILSVQKRSANSTEKMGTKNEKDPSSCDLNGCISLCHESCNSTSPVTGAEEIVEEHVLSSTFENPAYHDHIPRLLGELPEKTITEADIEARQLWHEYESFHPPTTTNPQRYAHKTRDTSRSAPENVRERWVGAGSGWSDCGRGAVVTESSHSSRDRGSFGRGHGFDEAELQYHKPFRAQASNARGRGFRNTGMWLTPRNSSSFDGGFQQPGRGPADRCENWREGSMPVAGSRGRGRSVHLSSNQRLNYSWERRDR